GGRGSAPAPRPARGARRTGGPAAQGRWDAVEPEDLRARHGVRGAREAGREEGGEAVPQGEQSPRRPRHRLDQVQVRGGGTVTVRRQSVSGSGPSQRSREATSSTGRRRVGRKRSRAPPGGTSAATSIWGGSLRSAFSSGSKARWRVVRVLPRPRARAASIRFWTAGKIEA